MKGNVTVRKLRVFKCIGG